MINLTLTLSGAVRATSTGLAVSCWGDALLEVIRPSGGVAANHFCVPVVIVWTSGHAALCDR